MEEKHKELELIRTAKEVQFKKEYKLEIFEDIEGLDVVKSKNVFFDEPNPQMNGNDDDDVSKIFSLFFADPNMAKMYHQEPPTDISED